MRFIICLIIGLFFIKPTLSKELLYSDEYIIDFLSENITKKKEEIINEIKYDSFKKIIISLLTNDEYTKLNKIIDINFINRFLYGIDIYEEKINNNTYFSKTKIAYDNSKIIDFFLSNNIDFIPYEPEKYLIIIFDQRIFSEKILSPENKYYKFLVNNKLKYEYFSIPNLDINDRFIVQKEDFFHKKISNYDKLFNKYKNFNILLVHSIFKNNEFNIYSYIYEDNYFYSLDSFFYKKIDYEKFFDDLQSKTLDYWKNKNIVNSSKLNQLECKVKTLNLVELKTIKKIINNNKMTKQIKANEISYNSSMYDLLYYGNLNILIKSLNKDKIHLEITDNLCEIKII